MDEINDRLAKYDAAYVCEHLVSAAEVNRFAATFYADVSEIYDTLTRIRNMERNPTGFSLGDAPILGLLVRMWKLLKEIIRYYLENNGEIVGVFERPFLEAAITARFLLISDSSAVEDYRKCSYKDRLRLIREFKSGSPFFQTKAGQRLLASVEEKLRVEQLTPGEFEMQKRNRWRLQGKTFYDIFATVESGDLYAASYGMLSEAIHGSWNDSMDFDLLRNDDGTFSAYPFFQPTDIRYVSPALRFSNPAFRLWLQRIDAYDEGLAGVLDWIERVNAALVRRFDETFDGT